MVGLDDVGVDEIGHQPGLADEILLELRDAGIFLPNQLDGDSLAEIAGALLHRLVNQTHSAFGQLVRQLVFQLVEDVLEGRHGSRKA